MKVDVKEFVKPSIKEKSKDSRIHLVVGGVILLGIVLSTVGVLTGIRAVADWGQTHKFVKQQVVSMHIQWPYRVETITPVVQSVKLPVLETDLENYICEKWGVVECKTALAIARAESNLNCNAFNVNTNGSVDFSIFQLNSVHLKKGGEWTLENMANCYKNVDLAHQLWLEQGWKIWVAYTNESYLSKL